MRVGIKPRTLIMFGMLLCFTSCGTGSCAGWGNAPRTEYYFQGGEVSFAEGTTSQAEVLDFTRELMGHQSYFADLWRVDADDSDERYKLKSPLSVSSTSSFNTFQGGSAGEPSIIEYMSGPLQFNGATLGFDLQVFAMDPDFTNLRAYGTCSLGDMQRLVKQVRLPAWGDNTSDDTALMNWTLTGEHGGNPFSVSFTQVFQGKSRYPVYPNYYR